MPDEVALTVANYGRPIPGSALRFIFRAAGPNPRVEVRSAQRPYTGLVLALFVVREIVSRHRGSIRIESDEEMGTGVSPKLTVDGDLAWGNPDAGVGRPGEHPRRDRLTRLNAAQECDTSSAETPCPTFQLRPAAAAGAPCRRSPAPRWHRSPGRSPKRKASGRPRRSPSSFPSPPAAEPTRSRGR
ncbi:MAG: hypothetical protein ACXWUL_00195 [Caldimonas sp.]